MHKKVLTDMAVVHTLSKIRLFFHDQLIIRHIPGYSYKVIHFNNGLHGRISPARSLKRE